MKRLAYLILFVAQIATAQEPYTNRPDLINPLLVRFQSEAMQRGIEVKERLAQIDSIMVIEQPTNPEGAEVMQSWADDTPDGVTYFRGFEVDGVIVNPEIWIELKRNSMEQNDGSMLRLFYHEVGHALGLEDCCDCWYNIMRCQSSERADYLFRDDHLTSIYLDAFFEAIRNPKKWNDGHTHY